MSLRAIATKLLKHGTALCRTTGKRHFNTTNIAEKINAAPKATPAPQPTAPSSNFPLRNVGVQLGLQARRILIDNVLNRVTNSLASDLRKKAARRILYGDSAPFFAFVGVSLASGTGILTKEDELEGVCWEIREAVSKLTWQYHDLQVENSSLENGSIALKDFTVGKPIAKGANAVVYAAKLNSADSNEDEREIEDNLIKFPLAIKMMFNYDIQSNALAILKGMYKETVPARMYYSNVGLSDWELDFSKNRRSLPPHANIVAMFSVFTDYVPELENCKSLYPAALPHRIHSEGEGRNMSLFLLMKRYHTSLQQYLSSTTPTMRTSLLLFTQILEGIVHLSNNYVAHRDLKSDNLLLDLSEPEAPILVITDFGCCLANTSATLTLPYNSSEVDRGGNSALMAPEIYLQQPGIFSVLNYSKSDLWAAGAIAYEIFGQENPFYKNRYRENLSNATYKEEDLPELPQDVPIIIKALIYNLLQRNPNKRVTPEVAANICQLLLWAPSDWLKPERTKLPSSTEILQWLLSLTTKVLCEGRATKSFGLEVSLGENQRPFTKQPNYKVGRRTYPEYLLISTFLTRAKLANIRAALNWVHSNVFD